MTRRISIAAAATMALALPAAADAAEPTKQDKAAAKQECRTLRGTTPATREAFKVQFGSLGLGRCINRRAADEQQERSEAKQSASAACRAERDADKAAFQRKFGSKGNGIGKCVSQQAKANKAEADREDAERTEARQNAAEQCDAERGDTEASRAAFAEKHGTNKNNRNAFGKCVSKTAQQQEQAQQS